MTELELLLDGRADVRELQDSYGQTARKKGNPADIKVDGDGRLPLISYAIYQDFTDFFSK